MLQQIRRHPSSGHRFKLKFSESIKQLHFDFIALTANRDLPSDCRKEPTMKSIGCPPIPVCICAALLLVASPLHAAENKETALETLKRVMKESEAEGLERVIGSSGAALREGGIGAVPVRLEQARPYRLTVIADDDASKLTVIVVDRDTKTVALEQAVDGRVLQANLAAPFTGSYEVAVRIGSCNVQPCGYRVVLHAPPSTGIRQMSDAPKSTRRPADPFIHLDIAAGERR